MADNPVMKRLLKFASIAGLLLLVLSACTVTTRLDGTLSGRVRFDTPVRADTVITEFRPTKGTGSIYRVGEPISFTIRSSSSGYVTLSYLDSHGNHATFARNIYIHAGRSTISGPDPRHHFTVAEPRGIMQIRASFTSDRTNESRVQLIGRGGNSSWNSVLVLDVQGQPLYDAIQTYIEVR